MSPSCFPDEGPFLSVFVHEVGHAFGFRHVSDIKAAMRKTWGYTPRFTAREEYHARLAYQVGRGQPYGGWPFSFAFGPTGIGRKGRIGHLPAIVVDD